MVDVLLVKAGVLAYLPAELPRLDRLNQLHQHLADRLAMIPPGRKLPVADLFLPPGDREGRHALLGRVEGIRVLFDLLPVRQFARSLRDVVRDRHDRALKLVRHRASVFRRHLPAEGEYKIGELDGAPVDGQLFEIKKPHNIFSAANTCVS